MTPLDSSTKPSRQVRRAPAPQSPEQQRGNRVETILTEGAAQTAEAAQAAAITQGHLTDAEVLAWRDDLQARLRLIEQDPEKNLGYAEEEIAAAKELQRLVAQRSAQAKANATACRCLKCQRELVDQRYLRRGIDSRFGHFVIWRRYGWCPKCQEWQFPADHALGLAKKAAASPYVQEISALLVTKMPPEQAVAVAERLGLDLSRCLLHREAHRQGVKALDERAQMVAELATWEDLRRLADKTSEGPPTQPFTLIIEIDAWNIRERNDWGLTQTLRREGKKIERWHWVYMATVFRLDHRGQTDGERAVITQRGFVATRAGIEALMAQLYREAIERGLGQAAQVLVIADGAVWIWNLAQDRFPHARQRLDLWHCEEHLWAVANDLYGKSTPEAAAWVAPLLQQIRADQTTEMIQSLKELLPRINQGLQEKVQKQIDYFANNAHRMKYKEIIQARQAVEDDKATPEQIRLANEPLGSGAIESTCRQYQCRFKRTGQFWTTAGDEAQGPGRYTIGVKVTDDGTLSLSDSRTFTVAVSEVNAAPVLAAVPDQTVEEGSLLSLTVTASDADLPANTLTFSLMPGAPAGAAINPATGEFSWTPTEAQGPGTYTIGVKVSDDGTPNLSAERTFSVVVVAGNTVICSMPKEFEAGVSFRVTNRAAPSVQVHCYTVVDRVPKDWVASDISDGGSYDPRSRWVRWGPFYDNAIRDLTYLVMPPRDARGTYTFKGQAKFDDTTVPITGQRETTAIEVNRIVRSLPATLRAGGSAWVSNEVTVAASVSIYVVEDQVPAGWTASVISDKGTFDPARHTVKWGPFADCVPRTLIYLVTAPPGAAGPAAFSGTGVFDGLAVAITGDETLIVLPNHPPVARGDLLERRPHGALVVPVEKLLANDTDPDGDALTLSSVPPASVRGAKLVLAGPMLVYIPPQGFNGPDSFTYTVSDDSGAMATATVHVVVKPSNKGAQLAAVTGETSTIAPQPGGAVRLRFTGRPGLAYLVQATASLANPEWITLTAFAGDQDGAFESEDPQAPDYPTRFYRALALPAP